MSTDRSYIQENARALARLRDLIAKLSDADLQRPLGGGWTVATALTHLAFWDRARLTALERWQTRGVPDGGNDSESVNAGVQMLSGAIPPRTTAQLAIASAEALDAALEQIAPELAAAIDASSSRALLRRSVHRNEHIDQIERALRS
jgi:hypothetical protein